MSCLPTQKPHKYWVLRLFSQLGIQLGLYLYKNINYFFIFIYNIIFTLDFFTVWKSICMTCMTKYT